MARDQARKAGHSERDEVGLLLTHGILHLLGYDHAEPDEERLMFGLQTRLVGEWASLTAAAEAAGGGRTAMTGGDVMAVVIAIIAEVAAGFLVAIESAVSRTSAARAQELADEDVRGAASLLVVVSDPARYITTVLFVRIVLSVLAVVIAASLIMARIEAGDGRS